MYNDYYLLKKIEDKEGDVSYASTTDSFTYKGEVVQSPREHLTATTENWPHVGDHVIFLKGSGEDLGDGLKAVKFEDIIKKI